MNTRNTALTEADAHASNAPVQLGTISAGTPAALVQGATEAANALADVVRKAGLSVSIQGREFVRVEGWTTLATMLGVIAREVSTEAREDGSYVSTVELVRMSDGAVISRASAECGGPDEPMWQKRPPYARRSMAQTRATGKACRIAFSWIMSLAGYEGTPAEEMEGVSQAPAPRRHAQRQSQAKAERMPTEKQIKRLFAIAREQGYDNERLKALMVDMTGVESTKDLTLTQYEALVQAVQERRADAHVEHSSAQDTGSLTDDLPAHW